MKILYVTSGPSLYSSRLVGPIHPDDETLAQAIADELAERDLADSATAADGVGATQQVDVIDGWPEGYVYPAGCVNATYGLPAEASATPYRLAVR